MTPAVSLETTGSVDATVNTKTITTDDVAALQTQLKAMQLFDGKVDGLFGGKTARAIKAFESKLGRTPRGLLTAEIVALAKSQTVPAPIIPAGPAPAASTPATAAEAVQVAAADPAPAPKSTVAPLALVTPLPAPRPLVANDQPVQVATADPRQLTPPGDPTAIVAPEDDSSPTPMANTAIDETPAVVTKRLVPTVAVHVAQSAEQTDDGSMPPPLTAANDVPPATDDNQVATDKPTISAVQRGLNSLGFLHGEITGVADEATAKAIRNFETYFNYSVSGRITRALVRVLQVNGADIEG
jgi:peptidoglycan hydrolase-like protein with peptidoglycan-binding domain